SYCFAESRRTGGQGSQNAQHPGVFEGASRIASGNGRICGKGRHRHGSGRGDQSTVAIGVARGLAAANESGAVKSRGKELGRNSEPYPRICDRMSRHFHAFVHPKSVADQETSNMRSVVRALVVTCLLCCFVIQIPAQTSSRTNGGRLKTPAADPNGKTPVSAMRSAIERYTVDRGSLQRSYPVTISRSRRERFKKFYEEWLSSLQSQDFDSMSQDGKIDYILFKTHLEYELRQLDIQSRQMTEIEPLVPFGAKIVELEEARRRMEPIDSAKIAATLNDLRKQVDERRRAIELGLRDTNTETGRIKKTVGNRAVAAINGLRNNLRNWYTFYDGYDPMFTWWNEEPYKSLDQSMTNYATFLSERVVGIRTEGSTQQQAGQGRGPGG